MRTAAPGRAVLFDWDGTLADSAETSFRCYVRLFGSFGIAFDRVRFEATYSPNWYKTYAAVGLPQERWGEADALWIDLYRDETPALVPGAREALERLRDAGRARGLVTSGSRERVAQDLVVLGVDGLFGAIVCSEDARLKKPHPEALLLALDRMGTEPGRAAYVGDSPEDVEMARAAGVFSVGVPGGFPNRRALRASAPDLLASDLAEAVQALLRR
ncbi:MAG: HAD family hydrolase [Acidobacteria bacterium]|nr:HAD family hydrolase [Acidobacteriota bacterium]